MLRLRLCGILFKKIKCNVHLIRSSCTRAYEGETRTVNSLCFLLSTHSYTRTDLAANNLGHNNITLPVSPSSSKRESSPKTLEEFCRFPTYEHSAHTLSANRGQKGGTGGLETDLFHRIQSGGCKFVLIYKPVLKNSTIRIRYKQRSQISTKGKGPANQIKQIVTGQSNSSESHTNQTDNGVEFGMRCCHNEEAVLGSELFWLFIKSAISYYKSQFHMSKLIGE